MLQPTIDNQQQHWIVINKINNAQLQPSTIGLIIKTTNNRQQPKRLIDDQYILQLTSENQHNIRSSIQLTTLYHNQQCLIDHQYSQHRSTTTNHNNNV
jgi:hypothetical protein